MPEPVPQHFLFAQERVRQQDACGNFTPNFSHMCIRDAGHDGRCFANITPYDQERDDA